MTLHPIPLNFLLYEENLIFFFISVETAGGDHREEEDREWGKGPHSQPFISLSFCSVWNSSLETRSIQSSIF
jgi:hypothetical protein